MPAVGGTIPLRAGHTGACKIPCAIRLRDRHKFVVHIDIEFPDLGAVFIKVSEVQKGQEPICIAVRFPCSDGERRAVAGRRCYGRLENGRWHVEAGVWLDVKLRRHVLPLWAGRPPIPDSVVSINRMPYNKEQ